MDLRNYLLDRLDKAAAHRHITTGEEAKTALQTILDRSLERKSGVPRRLAMIPTGELIDRYGRLLVYLAPWFSGTSDDPLPPRSHPNRRTINLRLIEAGWAAPFLIYPSLPENEDLNLLLEAADTAFAERRGIWGAGDSLLLGYEYRALVKLGREGKSDTTANLTNAFYRFCIDLRSLQIVGRYEYFHVPPTRRLWVWPTDLVEARRTLGLSD
jgi:hypothetical protein